MAQFMFTQELCHHLMNKKLSWGTPAFGTMIVVQDVCHMWDLIWIYLARQLQVQGLCHKIVNDFNDLVSANICGMAFALLKNLQ